MPVRKHHRCSAIRVDIRYRLWTEDSEEHAERTGYRPLFTVGVARKLRSEPPDRIHGVASCDAQFLLFRTKSDCREACPMANGRRATRDKRGCPSDQRDRFESTGPRSKPRRVIPEAASYVSSRKPLYMLDSSVKIGAPQGVWVRRTTRTVADARPRDRDRRYIVRDDELTGFRVRISPSGLRSFIVQYRTREGGRRGTSRKLVLGHHNVGRLAHPAGSRLRRLRATSGVIATRTTRIAMTMEAGRVRKKLIGSSPVIMDVRRSWTSKIGPRI